MWQFGTEAWPDGSVAEGPARDRHRRHRHLPRPGRRQGRAPRHRRHSGREESVRRTPAQHRAQAPRALRETPCRARNGTGRGRPAGLDRGPAVGGRERHGLSGRLSARPGDATDRRPYPGEAKTDAKDAFIIADAARARSIAALAREHGVSRGAIRTAVADLMPDHTAIEQEDVPAPELPVTLDMPGKIADFLCTADLEPAERAALDLGVTVPVRPGLHPARQCRPLRAPQAPRPLPAA